MAGTRTEVPDDRQGGRTFTARSAPMLGAQQKGRAWEGAAWEGCCVSRLCLAGSQSASGARSERLMGEFCVRG